MVLRGPGRGVMTYHTTGVSQSGSVRLGCSQKDSLRPCRVRRKPVLHYRTRLSAHATIRGGPGQPGERHTQCVRSPGPVPSSCAAGTTANQIQSSREGRNSLPSRQAFGSFRRWPVVGYATDEEMRGSASRSREAFPVAAVRVRRGYVSCSQRTRGRYRKRGKPSAGYGRALPKSAVLLNSALFARCCGPSRRPLTSRRLREPMNAQRGAGCLANMSRRYRLPLRSLRKSSSERGDA
jgi:hypothetical protein